jgi:hypothetical protein
MSYKVMRKKEMEGELEMSPPQETQVLERK